MRIAYISEIIGKSGIYTVKKLLGNLKKSFQPDFIIANANSASCAGGLEKRHAVFLKKLGVDCITAGDFIFHKADTVAALDSLPFVLRPFNIPNASPGAGYNFFTCGQQCYKQCYKHDCQQKIAVVSLLGRIGYHRLQADNPFTAIDLLLPRIQRETSIILVDFSAFATAEKQTMGFFLAGKVSAVIGSGTKALTADSRILAGSTAYITDAGRTGSFDSVGGYTPHQKIREYRSGLCEYVQDSWEKLCLQAVIVTTDVKGNASSIEPVCLSLSV
ncbi:MAG: TIGR00282 family metallophosphoesterase [Treponema sp.]